MAVTVPRYAVVAVPVQVGPCGYVASPVVAGEFFGDPVQSFRRFLDCRRESRFEHFLVIDPAVAALPGEGLE